MQLHKGVQKYGLMGFCDPCPGEEKMLRVTYTWRGKTYKVRGGNTSYVSHTQVVYSRCWCVEVAISMQGKVVKEWILLE